MLRCSRNAPALAVAAGAVLVAAVCSAPSAAAVQDQKPAVVSAGTISAGPAPTTFTALAFPAPANGWLLGQTAAAAGT